MNKGISRFLRIRCNRCRHKQVIFGKSSLNVKCMKCKRLLVETGGGKARVKACVTEIL